MLLLPLFRSLGVTHTVFNAMKFPLSSRGVQKQLVKAEPTKSDPESVQGILEICSKRFKPINEPHVCMSSR
jgi:hypothetical protein